MQIRKLKILKYLKLQSMINRLKIKKIIHLKNNILVNSNTNVHDLKPGNIFYGSIKYNNPKGKQQAQQGIFLILTSEVKGKKGQSREYTMTNCTGQEYKVCSGAIKKIANIADLKKRRKKIEKKSTRTIWK